MINSISRILQDATRLLRAPLRRLKRSWQLVSPKKPPPLSPSRCQPRPSSLPRSSRPLPQSLPKQLSVRSLPLQGVAPGKTRMATELVCPYLIAVQSQQCQRSLPPPLLHLPLKKRRMLRQQQRQQQQQPLSLPRLRLLWFPLHWLKPPPPPQVLLLPAMEPTPALHRNPARMRPANLRASLKLLPLLQ